MNATDIQHNENDRRGIFFIKEGKTTIAELTYSLEDNVMVIDHTETNPEYEGKGIGTQLVKASYAYAQENNFKVNPLCPFAEVVFDRHDDWSALRV